MSFWFTQVYSLIFVSCFLLGVQGGPVQQINDDVAGKTIDEIIYDALPDQVKDETHAVSLDVRQGPENNTVLVEMDMIYTTEQWEEMQKDPTIAKRKAIINEKMRWTDKVVPFEMDSSFRSWSDRMAIGEAFNAWHEYTCITFKKRTTEKKYIRLAMGAGCSSYVGMQFFSGQTVSLGTKCRNAKTIIHELGHVVGFQHEQCRPDRDDYINVHLENVEEKNQHNFKKYPTSSVQGYGISYDYGSVMHYGETAFSKNGQRTMTTTDPAYQKKIGTAPTLSYKDIKLANIIYKCSEGCPPKNCPADSYMDKNCNCMCRGSGPYSPVKKC